ERDVAQKLERGEVLEVHAGPDGLAQTGLGEIHGQRPAEVEEDEHREDDPGADERAARVADVGADVAVAGEGLRGLCGRVWVGAAAQKIFSIRWVGSARTFATSSSMRSNV